ncbi:MAG TPA: DUF2203 domain-containing protein [Longimicrobiales bacterium]|nr:DUF2203 domain-containing protein [Longimicrobiales bacterium]
MEPLPERIFTVEEADALVSVMAEVMAEVGRLTARVQERTTQIQVLDVLWGPKVRQPHNPDHREYREHETAVGRAVERIEGLIRDEILARGVRFPPGGLEHGLLDFPTTLDGRVVFLSWRLWETGVGHWHEIDGGFAGRRPVTPDLARRMGVESG